MTFDLDGFTPPRTWNWSLAAPAGKAMPGARCASPAFDASLDELRKAVLATVQAEPRTDSLGADPDGTTWRFRARSRLLGLPDLITVRLVELADGRVSLAIFSRARYGFHDLGVNRRRVKRWLRQIEAALSC